MNADAELNNLSSSVKYGSLKYRLPNQWAAQLLMLASGFAGLGYQIVWTQQCALWLGHEAAAVIAVIAAFFGGMAVGAFFLGRAIECSTAPARWYAACEAAIAVWSLLLAVAMQPFSVWLLQTTGALPTPLWQWSIAFFGTFILLLPATAAMGATLPAMQRATTQLRGAGHNIAALYASNTFGAVIGVLVIAFVLIPSLGLLRTTIICAALNLCCSAVALIFLPQRDGMAANDDNKIRINTVNTIGTASQLFCLACTGLLGIGYEVLVVRVLSQVAEDTVYTFAILLAIYLVGSAIGANIYQHWFSQKNNQQTLTSHLLSFVSIACLIGTGTLWSAEVAQALALQALGSSMAAALTGETALAIFAFGLPTIAMGALFSHLSKSALVSGIHFGEALAANTFGAAMAPIFFGVLIYPLLGPKFAVLLISIGYAALIVWRNWSSLLAWVSLAAAAMIALCAPSLAFIDVPEGGRVVSYKEGIMASVSVVEDADGVARLRINNRQQEGSSATLRVDGRQALLPIYLHPSPQHVLFLGLGTGVTATVAAAEPGLHVDAAELLPEVITASQYFENAVDVPGAHPHVVAADARRYVRTTDQIYDVIISDNFHPARSGSGSLYTVEHFTAVHNRLATDGFFCQWLPLHQLDLVTLRSIVQSFLIAYPHAWAMLASNSLETPVLGLIGSANNDRFDINAVRQRLANAPLPERLAAFGIEDEFALLGSFVAGPNALQHFAGDAPANTDDLPVVTYRAPRITYAPDSQPRDRLIALLQQLSIEPAELIRTPAGTDIERAAAQRLSAYWAARNRFIELGRNVRPVANAEDMLAQVREPLLTVLHISSDFRPAYDPLLLMAKSLAANDASAARALLTELTRVQPARPEANFLLEKIALEKINSNEARMRGNF